MARILVNMPSQYGGIPSGVARMTFALLDQLVRLGTHQFILRSPWKLEEIPLFLRDKIELLTLPRPKFMIASVVRDAIVMPLICRRVKAEIVWNVDCFGAPYGGRSRVTTVHDFFYQDVQTLSNRAKLTMATCYNLVLRGSTKIISVSDHTGSRLIEAFPALEGRMSVIANDATLASETLQCSDEPRFPAGYILIVGNATPNKNFGIVVQAAAHLNAQGRPLTVIHVGADNDKMLKTAVTSCRTPPSIIHLSGVKDQELANLYRHALCLVTPSVSEGFCLPILEAQSMSCPVIASNISVLPEVAGDGALYFDPCDSASLAAHINALMDDDLLRSDLIKRGHINRARYSWENSAIAYDHLFSELAG